MRPICSFGEVVPQLANALFAVILVAAVAGCDRMITPRNVQQVKDADSASKQGDYARAITLYERSLDGTSATAEIHYKLGLLYDDKLNDPIDALHHFKRYVSLLPEGARTKDVREFIKRDETTLVTSLGGDSLVTRGDAAKLRNENFNLRKQLEDRISKAKTGDEPAPRAAPVEKKSPTHEKRSYVVAKGDTLFSISRKFYKSPSRWKDIKEANRGRVDSPSKLSPGTTLTIPP